MESLLKDKKQFEKLNTLLRENSESEKEKNDIITHFLLPRMMEAHGDQKKLDEIIEGLINYVTEKNATLIEEKKEKSVPKEINNKEVFENLKKQIGREE